MQNNTNFDYSGKTVLISGGNSGIGKACALMFAAAGASVMIAARRETESLAVVDEIREAGGTAEFVKTDMADTASIQHMMETTVARFGKVDFAINNAGIVGPTQTPLADYPEADFDQVMNVNVKGVFTAMQCQLKHMSNNQSGVIINMSSVAGLRAGRASSVYTASKHAIVGMSRAAAREYAGNNIRINALCPALIETSMVTDTSLSQHIDLIPLQRLGKTEEVASAAMWLCSDMAGFITGTAMPIDGGVCA